MFCTTNVVCITRQKSASQLPRAIYMTWLSHGGTRADHTLAQSYSPSHTLFSMQRKTRKRWEGVEHHATCQEVSSTILREQLPS